MTAPDDALLKALRIADGAFDDSILAMWSGGRNTADIAAAFGAPESVVANRLPKVLERRREQRSVGT